MRKYYFRLEEYIGDEERNYIGVSVLAESEKAAREKFRNSVMVSVEEANPRLIRITKKKFDESYFQYEY